MNKRLNETAGCAHETQWLWHQRRNAASCREFSEAQLNGLKGGDLAAVAGRVWVQQNQRFILTKDLAAEVIGSVRENNVFEQWDFDCACAIYNVARSLSALEGMALLAASGYLDQSLVELGRAARDASKDALAAQLDDEGK